MSLLHTDIKIDGTYQDPLGQQYKVIDIVGFGTAAIIKYKRLKSDTTSTMHINQFLLLVRKKL